LPKRGTVQEFRIALLEFVQQWRLFNPKLTTADIETSLDSLGLALKMDEYASANPPHEPDWVFTYVNQKHLGCRNPEGNGDNWH